MNDIFGREVKRGDIIVYGTSTVRGFTKFAESKLGVVNSVIPRRTHVRNSSMWRKMLKDSIAHPACNLSILPGAVDTYEKVAFYPIFNGDNTRLQFAPTRKNGKVKRNVILTTSFLIIDKESLSADWKESYDEVCKAFKI